MKLRNIVFLLIIISIDFLMFGCDKETKIANHILKGIEYSNQGKYEQAISELQKGIEIDPQHADAHYNLGLIYHTQGKLDDAITKYRKTIELDPNYQFTTLDGEQFNSHYGLARVYSEKNELEAAIKSLQKAIDLDESYIDWSKTDGNLNNIRQTPEYQQLITNAQQTVKIVEADPNDSQAHFRQGMVHLEKGRLNDAIISLEKVIAINPNNPQAYDGLGWIYIRQGKLDDVITKFQQAIEIDSKEASRHHDLAGVYSLKKEHQKAIKHLQKAIDLDRIFIEISKTNPNFDNIRQTPEFQQLINSY